MTLNRRPSLRPSIARLQRTHAFNQQSSVVTSVVCLWYLGQFLMIQIICEPLFQTNTLNARTLYLPVKCLELYEKALINALSINSIIIIT